MNRQTRNRLRLIFVLGFLFFAMLAVVIRLRLYPLVDEMAVALVENQMSDSANQMIYDLIVKEDMDYEDIVVLNKDENGQITALQTNMVTVNYIKTQLLQLLNEEVMELGEEKIGVPIGSLVFPELFSGHGFYFPVKIISIRGSDASFHNNFIQGGINQTVHQIIMEVDITSTILTPSGTHTVKANTQVVIAETVIVGGVPGSYVDISPQETEEFP